MVNGVQCVMMDGIGMMDKLYARNSAMAMQSVLQLQHFMGRVMDQFGLMIWSALVWRELLETVHTEDGG